MSWHAALRFITTIRSEIRHKASPPCSHHYQTKAIGRVRAYELEWHCYLHRRFFIIMADSGRKQGRGRGKGVAGGGGDTDDESELDMSSDFSSGESSDEATTTGHPSQGVDVDDDGIYC